MYEAFFQFESQPFPATPDVANYFPAQSMETARQSLVRVIERAEGPALVIGPAGVGKTLLLRVLADHFSRQFRAVMLSGTRLTTRKSLLQNILFELALPYRGLDEGELRLSFLDALRHGDNLANGVLLLLDEAQVMPLRLLDEVRLITNVMHNGQPRVRLVVAGDPRLEEHFTSPQLDSFNQRIAARCYLQAFTREEMQEYIRAEVSWAGGNPEEIFPAPTVRAIFQATDGIPRLINQICDRALILSHALGQIQVDPARVREAWADVQQLPPPWESPRTEMPASTSTVIEFGELDEAAVPRSNSTAVAAADATTNTAAAATNTAADPAPIGTSDPYVAQNDTPWSEEDRWLAAEFESATVTVQAPYSGDSVEWFSCGECPPREVREPRVEPNPFQDRFEEDIVVIDRLSARSLEHFRGRPRVSCAESHELARSLTRVHPPRSDLPVPASGEPATCFAPHSDIAVHSALAYSSVAELPEIDRRGGFGDTVPAVGSPAPDLIDLDFDEEVECVPFPWLRQPSGDDREIIIVEELEALAVSSGSALTASGSHPSAPYRELFAQLRKVSP